MNKNKLTQVFQDSDLIEEFFKPFYRTPFLSTVGREISSDVEETDSYYCLSVDVPGIDPQNIKLKLQDQTFSVMAEEDSNDKNIKRKRSFHSSFTLPAHVDISKIEAHVENGVMDIILPKKQAFVRQIPVHSSSSKGFVKKIKQQLQSSNKNH